MTRILHLIAGGLSFIGALTFVGYAYTHYYNPNLADNLVTPTKFKKHLNNKYFNNQYSGLNITKNNNEEIIFIDGKLKKNNIFDLIAIGYD